MAKYSQRANPRSPPKVTTEATSAETSPYYDPFRHYDRELIVGIPSHFTMPRVDALYKPFPVPKDGISRLTEREDDSFSDKEVFIVPEQRPIEWPVDFPRDNSLDEPSDELRDKSQAANPESLPAQPDEEMFTTSSR